MLAFVNTEMTKDAFMANLRAHAADDEIVRGLGYDGSHGCLVGCSFNEYDHSRGPAIAGVPVELWHLADAIHEGLTDEPHLFPLQFGDAIRVGADLTKIHWQFLVWLLTDGVNGIKRFSGDPAWGVAAAIDQVSALCARMAVGDPVAQDDWAAAWAAAWAADNAAWPPARGAKAPAMASNAAAWAAAHAAHAAAMAAVGGAAMAAMAAHAAAMASNAAAMASNAAYIAMRDKLIELIKAA